MREAQTRADVSAPWSTEYTVAIATASRTLVALASESANAIEALSNDPRVLLEAEEAVNLGYASIEFPHSLTESEDDEIQMQMRVSADIWMQSWIRDHTAFVADNPRWLEDSDASSEVSDAHSLDAYAKEMYTTNYV